MNASESIEKVYQELKALRDDVNFIKTHMFDPDTIMSIEEEKRFKQSLKELKAGKTTSLANLKKELGV